jgi:PAS domain-containing protein
VRGGELTYHSFISPRNASRHGAGPLAGELITRLALAVADAPDFDATLGTVLDHIGAATGWDFGQAWVPTPDGNGLACRPVWYGDVDAFAAFRRASESRVFRRGEGLPGRAWASMRPEWSRALATDLNFPRLVAAGKVGLRAGMAIPVRAGEDLAAVLEFFVVHERDEDADLVKLIAATAALLGTALARRRADEALRESEARLRSVAESAVDAIVLADRAGVIVAWNGAAETMFGYAEADALGQPVTLIMPAALPRRPQARSGATGGGWRAERRRERPRARRPAP